MVWVLLAYLQDDHIVFAVVGVVPALHAGVCFSVLHNDALAQVIYAGSLQTVTPGLQGLVVVLARHTYKPVRHGSTAGCCQRSSQGGTRGGGIAPADLLLRLRHALQHPPPFGTLNLQLPGLGQCVLIKLPTTTLPPGTV
jgi:hypothetical protein